MFRQAHVLSRASARLLGYQRGGEMKPDYSIDTGPMVPGRKRSKPSKGGKNNDSEKTPFLFPRWETKYVDSIDVLDAVGTNIRIGARFNNIIDIRACPNQDVNKDFATDKARFSYDGLSKARITEPMIRNPSGALSTHGWDEILQTALAGPFTDAETLTVTRDLLNILGSESYFTEEYCAVNTDFRSHYLMNMPLTGIEYADCIILVGFNPRLEAPLVNTRIQKTYHENKCKVGIVGLKMNLGYSTKHLGASPDTISELADGTHSFCETLFNSRRPMILCGSGIHARPDAVAFNHEIQRLTNAIKGNLIANKVNETDMMGEFFINGIFNTVHLHASLQAALDLGWKSGPLGIRRTKPDVLLLLGADGRKVSRADLCNEYQIEGFSDHTTVIYIGTHMDAGAELADIILPSVAYTEKSSTFVNLEGRPQRTRQVVTPPSGAIEDWKIVQMLSEELHTTLPYETIQSVRNRMYQIAPNLVRIGFFEPNSFYDVGSKYADLKLGDSREQIRNDVVLKSTRRASVAADYWMTDPITRNSETMDKCVRLAEGSSFDNDIAIMSSYGN
ncbi:Oidioi.mRNA.OKI2018_I69.XSR.g16623.t1.cds [Oikopleura dioica]|uniref:NADH-ubiquinone oxidoreductase 75 kDa subunit, mitochondrial n=1 Tax=Oikopleura dioica TaxID=34765 RepID=A0ABN7SH71_OIKDI|nr:Oidioi.mRNA.OKI2018_I69.XSR.g16623.t1.cds [Oikopleura dioica]